MPVKVVEGGTITVKTVSAQRFGAALRTALMEVGGFSVSEKFAPSTERGNKTGNPEYTIFTLSLLRQDKDKAAAGDLGPERHTYI